MTAMIKSAAARAMTDRKGVTALEYALIAAAVVTIVLVAYKSMFGTLATYINTISFG